VSALEASLQRSDARPLLVGLSGGLDSIVLLHALATGTPTRDLRAVHVHHGLHPDADAWTAHCERACAGLGVPLVVVRVEVERDAGNGLEAAARAARHAAFATLLREDEVLALAHHRDDQAETFLLRALRASGPDGLGAMRPWRRFGQGWLWRPLLGVPRSELLGYARQRGLAWIEDPSNVDTGFDRNFLRHRVLPLLRERWPQADAAFARGAALNAEAGELLDAEDAIALAGVRCADPNVLDAAAVLALPAARRARVLRRWIHACGLPPLPAQGVERIGSDLLVARPDGQAAFTWADAVVRRWRGLLHADRHRVPLPPDWQVGWDGSAPLPLPTGATLSLHGAGGFDAPVRVHARLGGERITLPGRGHAHALKHVLQQLGVPPWERACMPLLSATDGVLLAAGDLAYSAAFDAWLRERAARLVWSD
jgi:tRNA(Ile)-lysidine synthase